MGLDRESIPDTYLCEICEPRPFDREGAKALQMRKRTELNIDTSETDSSDEIPDQSGKSGNEAGKKGKWQKEKKTGAVEIYQRLSYRTSIMRCN